MGPIVRTISWFSTVMLAGALVVACGGTTTETVVVPEGTTTGTGSGTSGTSSTTGTPTTTTGPGTTSTGPGDTSGDTGGDTTDTGGDTGVDPSKAPKCGVEDQAGLAIGEECSEHADCETGYCYDEYLWNEDGSKTYRFCTVACTGCTVKGNCNEWGKAAGIKENKCFPLTSNFINFFELKFDSLCLASCVSDGDCAGMGPFSTCKLLSFGKDFDYGVVKICQPPDFPKRPAADFK